MIANVDAQVGRMLDALDNFSLTDRTLVIFTSDNGTTHARNSKTKFHVGGVDAKFFNSTGGLRGYKGSVYEGGLRVPMIARLPGSILAGTVNASPSYFPDWFPTLCAAANLPVSEQLDGVNLWPTLTGGPAIDERPPMLWVFPEYGGQVAVRLGDLKVLRTDLSKKQPNDWEVYNLATDPAETTNIAADRLASIAKAEEILRHEVMPNAVFPLKIPGVN
jgi:arylsulfatase A-like enzyme